MPAASEFQPRIAHPAAAIAAGQAASDPVDLGGTTLCGLYLPAAFTGTSLTFQASPSAGGTYQTIQKSGADLSIAVAPGKYAALSPGDFAGVQFLKIVSNANEAAPRSLTLALRPV